MDKTILKNFAVYARDKLIQDTKTQAALYGITEKEIIEPEEKADFYVFNIESIYSFQITGLEIYKYKKLVKELEDRTLELGYDEAYKSIIEEVAYTWFNRLIAIRFMEVNRYLPNNTRVLSSEIPQKIEPDMLSEYTEMDFKINSVEQKEFNQLIEEGTSKTIKELFQKLFIKECNYLYDYLPLLFEKTNDYSELLLNISFNDENSVVYKLVHDIPEDYFWIIDDKNYSGDKIKGGQVEIIGWLYQYYNSQKRDEVIKIYSKKTVVKEDIPAATQLFTTDWVVRYMVDNSLGKYWIERNPHSSIRDRLAFLMPGDIEYVDEKISPEELTIFDDAMGSGHCLVYAFDVLMEIYLSESYTSREAAKLILTKNLYGVDIDKRAFQLAYFSLLMKARNYNRRILTQDIELNLYSFKDSSGIRKDIVTDLWIELKNKCIDNKIKNKVDFYEYIQKNCVSPKKKNDAFTNEICDIYSEKVEKQVEEICIELYDSNDIELRKRVKQLINIFENAEELGSIINFDEYEILPQKEYVERISDGQLDFENTQLQKNISILKELDKVAKLFKNRYHIVVTNPPYLNKFSPELKKYINDNYKDYKGDLFSVFIYRNIQLCKDRGYSAYMTPMVWMFIKTYEQLRKYIINDKHISSLIQMEYSAFEEATVPICTFVIQNTKRKELGKYIRLADFVGGMKVQEIKTLQAINTPNCDFYHESNQNDFNRIPGSPIAYWASESILKAFDKGYKMEELIEPKVGLQTGNNNRFLRYWWEVDNNSIKYDTASTEESKTSGYKWVPYNKGGERRQWFGNYDYIVNWENDGYEIKHFTNDKGKLRSRPQNTDYYFKEALTWPLITSSEFSIRYREKGSIHDVAGMSAFKKNGVDLWYILGLMSTKISNYIFKFINPTINLQIGDFNNFPVVLKEDKRINELVMNSISISKNDWDTFEKSWNFMYSPLINKNYITEITVAGSKFAGEEVCLDVNQVEKALPLELAYDLYKEKTNSMFNELKENEEKLNRIFIEIYGLDKELTTEVNDRDITIAKIFDSPEDIDHEIKGNQYILTKEKVIKQFLSFIVGCIFGRYSLDKEGLILTDGNFEGQYDIYENQGYLKELVYNNNSEINSDITEVAKDHFGVSIDNIIPITEEKIFENDIVNKVIEFLKYAFGEESLKDNLEFIAEAIGGKEEPEAVIRNYFIKDFYKDHIKAYNKRPIYWLYDSGKFNGFKALVYMHRYDADTTGKVRMDYLHEVQKHYDRMIAHFQYQVDNNSNPREVVKAEKSIKKYRKQVKECEEYDEKVGHLALDRIEIDLDDGVKVNYEKIQTDKNDKHHQILQKLK